MPDTDSSLISGFLQDLATPSIEAFLKAVLHDPAFALEVGALETTPETIAAFAATRGYRFTADELTGYVDRRLRERLSDAEFAARERYLAAVAAGTIAAPPLRDEPTPARFAELPPGAPLDRRFVLEGGVTALRGVPALAALVALLDTVLCTVLEIDDLALAHEAYEGAAFDARAEAAYDALAADKRVPAAVVAVIEALGMAPDDVIWEWPGCRLLRPVSAGGMGRYRKAFTGALPPHRDTWYGSPFHQINLWGPVRAMSQHATLRILPDYFRRTFDNSSRGYDVWQNAAALALAPCPRDTAAMETFIAPALAVGDAMAFSGQQLHASGAHLVGRTRVSFEFRLLHRADERQPWVPANTDYYGRGEIYRGWYDAAGDEVWRL